MLEPNLGIKTAYKIQKHNDVLQNNKTELTIHPDNKQDEDINIIIN